MENKVVAVEISKIQDAVIMLEAVGLANVYQLRMAGFSRRQCEAAVRRGELAWESDGSLTALAS